MGDQRHGRRVVLLSRGWEHSGSETAFVDRSVAGALSVRADVDVLVPGRPGGPKPDGAFDLHPVGTAAVGDGWPEPGAATWPDLPVPALAVVGTHDRQALGGALDLLSRYAPGVPVAAVTSTPAVPDGAGAALAVFEGTGEAARRGPGAHLVGLHVPVNLPAAVHRHNALGFTGYVLVLTDRSPAGTGPAGPAGPASDDPRAPTPLAAWLAARFPRRYVVVVENATASVWRWRSLRGHVAVSSRTDLWILMAHAQVLVDLRPGGIVARECVEALRYGTPVVVPAGTMAAGLAAAGGGLWYGDVAQLLGAVAMLDDPAVRAGLGAQGRAVADERYGNLDHFVARVGTALEDITGPALC